MTSPSVASDQSSSRATGMDSRIQIRKGRRGFPGRPSKSSKFRVYVSALGFSLRMQLEAIKCAIFAAIVILRVILQPGLQPQRAWFGRAAAHVFASDCLTQRLCEDGLMEGYREHGFVWLVLQVSTRRTHRPFTYEPTFEVGQENFSQIKRNCFSVEINPSIRQSARV